jgi:6-pyruvoyltetrahydropterin/6-carboxytetrahydropterin synthase
MEEHLFFTAATNFEAARQVELLPVGHRSRSLHGHGFLAKVCTALPSNWASFPGAEVGDLHQRLVRAVSPLDYSHLNLKVTHPTDENLARWVRDRLDIATVANIGIQSTEHEGVDLSSDDHAHIWRRYTIESAHQLPNVPVGHKCGRMHGHSFQIILHADQDLKTRDMGIDYDHLDRVWQPIHEELNFACLNDIPGLENPTSEVISSWIWHRLKPTLPELSWVTVYETASCGAHFDGTHYRIWKEMSFDSAVQLKHAPEGDLRRRIHGHTYTLRLHLRAPLDKVMGWTVDFGDVKELFNPIFKDLDHQPLYERLGGQDTDVASLVRWIRDQAQPIIPELDRIDLYESRGCGVTLAWGDVAPLLPV